MPGLSGFCFLDSDSCRSTAQSATRATGLVQALGNSENFALGQFPVMTSAAAPDNVDWPREPDAYELITCVGRGASASVWKARCIPLDRMVAIKILDLESFTSSLDQLHQEVASMKACEHPNIISYYCSFVESSHLWLVMQFLAAGSIGDMLAFSYPNGLGDEVLIATILRGALAGLEYLHQSGRLHRDIKGGNILLSSEGEVVLCDFGVAANVFEGKTLGKRVTFVGTLSWMAPEVVEKVGYNSKADIWSFGITALELAEGKGPYQSLTPLAAVKQLLKSPPPTLHDPKKWSKSFHTLISQCLEKDPSKRPTATKLLEAKFFKQARKPKYVKTTLLSRMPTIDRRCQLHNIPLPEAASAKKPPEKNESGEWIFDDNGSDDSGGADGEKGDKSTQSTQDKSSLSAVVEDRQSAGEQDEVQEKKGRFRIKSIKSSADNELTLSTRKERTMSCPPGQSFTRKGRFKIKSKPSAVDSAASLLEPLAVAAESQPIADGEPSKQDSQMASNMAEATDSESIPPGTTSQKKGRFRVKTRKSTELKKSS